MQKQAWLRSLALLTSLAAGAWGAGCGSDNNNKTDGGVGGHGGNGGAGGHAGNGGAAGGPVDAGLGDAGAVLSDGQIASIMIEANTGEVAAASVALAKATGPMVTTFAALMVTDHTAANGHLAGIVQQQNIALADSVVRQMLAMQAAQTVNTLIATPSSTFDQAYVSSQIAMHTMVLQLLDGQLIPNAQNAALKAELQMERTTVMNHLTAAQQLQTSLADGGATDAATGN